jgi:serine-type D-Ala-D-Ala carboxypeptidase/endopeptidase
MNRLTTLLAGAAVTLSASAAAQEAAGDWFGILEVSPQAQLPVVVHIKRDDAGVLSGTLDSPAQGANGMPLAEIAVEAGRLGFKVPVVGGSYEGSWDEASKTWQGTWRQGAGSLPLALGVAPADLPLPPPPPPLPTAWQVPGDAAIETLIAERLAPRAGQGLVVGVLSPEGRRVVAGGPAGAARFTGDTVFEIGSISKVFTALILADMANKGEVSLDDPAAKYLPEGATMPERSGRKITLSDLSTHMSGLPRLPDNMPFGDPENPYADYTEAQLLEFLAGHELTRDIGERWEYSNFGVGLLGYLLGRAAGSDYETLLRERITGPLGMADTSVALPPAQQGRFAPPFDTFMRPAKPWDLPTLVGAGGIRSTADDMLKFAAAALDPASPIGPAMTTALGVRAQTGSQLSEQALGWQVFHPEPGREIVMHGGGTGGFRTHLALEPAKARAVVALANSAAEPSAADLAIHVLVGSPIAPTPPVPPAPPPPTARTEAALPVTELDRIVGRYDFGDGILAITRDGTRLNAARAGVQTLQIFPEAPLQFFYKAIDAQLRFTADDSGKVTGVVFTMPGLERAATRLEP